MTRYGDWAAHARALTEATNRAGGNPYYQQVREAIRRHNNMKITTKKQEEARNEEYRRTTEQKLIFMGNTVGRELLLRIGWKDDAVPDLSAFIARAAEDISYADAVIN